MNLSDPSYSFALQEIGQLCRSLNLSPQFLEPETPPGPRRLYTHADHISQLIENYGIQISPAEFKNWRALSKASGRLPTFDETVWIMCTDGIIAWFVTWSGKTLVAELDNFNGPKTYWAEDDKEEREVKQAKAHEERMEDLLAELLGE